MGVPRFHMQAHFDLELMKSLVSKGCLRTTRKSTDWLINHGYSRAMVKEVLLSLEDSDLYKVYPPDRKNAAWADAYRCDFENGNLEEELYVKFTIEEENLIVTLLSLKEWNYGW